MIHLAGGAGRDTLSDTLVQARDVTTSRSTQGSLRPALLLVAARDFSFEEYRAVHDNLARDMPGGFRLVTAASDTTTAIATNDSILRIDLALRDVVPADYSALIVIGGIGSIRFWTDSLVLQQVSAFAHDTHVVAAIGIAAIVLAKAGVLAGRKATVYGDFRAIKMLEEGGAHFALKDVVADGNILTASDYSAGAKLARAIRERLMGHDPR